MSALSAAKEHERCIDPGRRIFAASRTAAFLIAAIFSSMLVAGGGGDQQRLFSRQRK